MSNESSAHSGHGHVVLRIGSAASGEPVYETLPARAVGPGTYELTGSPGLVEGCAAGDVLKVDADGTFRMERRGPNLCVQAFGDPPFTAASLDSLTTAFAPLNGLVEAPADRRFIVVTVPTAAGVPAVETVMEAWASAVPGRLEWDIGNI
ncbi:DUF4265 domain-containing protein [Streptomyces sp. Amel2xC10]|uniref:DUF4265 domain-containing protein n=1 Tax=Streptomyces sp. Amel2xC10 TaxID=1305826 RepID=UPI000A08222C|nr:DUF4265 domain-containing protein [Streptomyces sp. Amel2xC10]SMF64411.1 protein of unknown function [Streptomyces sp. Amel2xC10]